MANSMDEGDRISMLPDEIIGRILSFLPMKRAIQTGFLSNRWRDLWKSNPVLEFSSVPISSPEAVDYSFINHCLSLYIPSRIEKLIIVLYVGNVSHPFFEDWVDFAIGKHVRSLEFYWLLSLFDPRFFELPKSFYAGKNTDFLENLVLSRVRFSPQLVSGLRGFRFLKSLTLFKSVLGDEELEDIMTTCLVLERLALHQCLGHYRVKVSSRILKEFKFYPRENGVDLEILAPNLVTLKILGCLNTIRLDNSCKLLEASLFDSWLSDLEKSSVKKFTGQLNLVKVLSANQWLLEFLIEEHYANGNRWALFKNLKEFYFHGSELKDEYNMVMFFVFLEDCPLLNKIHIDFRMSCWTVIHKKLPSLDFKPPLLVGHWGHERLDRSDYFAELDGGEQLLRVGLLHHVKSIELLYFSGFKYEMELVKRMLEKTSSLERLSLLFEDPDVIDLMDEGLFQFRVSLQQRELLLEEICLFPRASSHAQILII